MKATIAAMAVVVIATTGCDNREDVFEIRNRAPEIIVIKGIATDTVRSETVTDTVKIGYEKTYRAMVRDEENLSVIRNYDENEVTVNIKGQNRFTVDAQSEGLKEIRLTAKDHYGMEATRTMEVYVFRNWLPVASFEVTVIGEREIEVNANTSYDSDRNYGGSIVSYEYNLNGVITENNLSTVRYRFGTGGTKRIELRVKDNSGGYSERIFTFVDV